MSFKKSEKNKERKSYPKSKLRPYKSLYGDSYRTEAEYLTERLFKIKSEKQNSGNLPEFFWRLPRYGRQFGIEISKAHDLLKDYPILPILQALQSPKSRHIMSLRNKKLIPIIEEFNRVIKEVEFNTSEKKNDHRIPFGGKRNLWSELNG
jgi:hypothetical protein